MKISLKKNCAIGHRFFLILAFFSTIDADVIINEVASSGSQESPCGSEDWVELFNKGDTSHSLENYKLADDKGPDDDKAYMFPEGSSIDSDEYMVLCKSTDFAFGIGSADTVTLFNNVGSLVSTSGALPGTGGDDMTYAFFPSVEDEDGGEYKYTATPTPGTENVFTEPETLAERLEKQNALGSDFFRMNDDGTTRTTSPFADVVDLYIDLEATDLEFLKTHPGYEEYVPFTQIRVMSGTDETTLENGGRLRPKGQSSLFFPKCLGDELAMPYQIDFGSQTLFGVETGYVRNHLGDASFMREHAMHRLNGRFGLPFLRTRPVRLFLNNVFNGFYTFMEAPSQDYVMQRSFGPYDPEQTALFKFKILSRGCGVDEFPPDLVAYAEASPVPDPYYFERGSHRADIPIYGPDGLDECSSFFYGEIEKEYVDVVKGWVEYEKDCGTAMVELGRVDRDLGPKSLEETMISWLNDNYYNEDQSGFLDTIDTDQWLKNFASYAVMVNFDSPVNNFNNWYLATTAGGKEDWRIVQYDHNIVLSRATICGPACDNRLIYQSILRPMCSGTIEDHRVLGPILGNNDENVQKYLGYVEEFATTLLTSEFFDELRDFGLNISEFAVYPDYLQLSEDFVTSELSPGFNDYNSQQMPFIKTLQARREQVVQQIEALKNDAYPRGGMYSDAEICPDWRDMDGSNYMESSAFVLSTECTYSECAGASPCYDHNTGICPIDGSAFTDPNCSPAEPICDTCFPFSRCGTLDDKSTEFKCDDNGELAYCSNLTNCYSHTDGICAFDGEILIEECKPFYVEACKGCFPLSRCGDTASTNAPSNSPTNIFTGAPTTSPTDILTNAPTTPPKGAKKAKETKGAKKAKETKGPKKAKESKKTK